MKIDIIFSIFQQFFSSSDASTSHKCISLSASETNKRYPYSNEDRDRKALQRKLRLLDHDDRVYFLLYSLLQMMIQIEKRKSIFDWIICVCMRSNKRISMFICLSSQSMSRGEFVGRSNGFTQLMCSSIYSIGDELLHRKSNEIATTWLKRMKQAT